MTKTDMRLTILALTLNEIDGVKTILPRIDRAWYDQLIVVDGGSTDGTIEWCRNRGYEVHVQYRRGIRFGYLEVLDKISGDVVLTLSPDGNCDPRWILPLSNRIQEGFDLVIGSRYKGDAKSDDDGIMTGFGNWLFTKTVNALHGGSYTDCMVIYRAFRRELIWQLDLDKDESYELAERLFRTIISWEPLMSVRAARRKLRIDEIGVGEPARIGGKRKLQMFRWGAAYYFQFWYEALYGRNSVSDRGHVPTKVKSLKTDE
jgi:glycosyltransferase involved in cell wall biosynthesis